MATFEPSITEINFKNFRGTIVCLESSYVEEIRTRNIVVKEKEQAINVILILYNCFNSYHIFPYDLKDRNNGIANHAFRRMLVINPWRRHQQTQPFEIPFAMMRGFVWLILP